MHVKTASLVLATAISISGCSGRDTAPPPAPSPQISTAKFAAPTLKRVVPRLILADRFEGRPSTAQRAAFNQVSDYADAHPERFGGVYFDFAYSAIHVWTVDASVWNEPQFRQLRSAWKSKNVEIVPAGRGKSLSYLVQLENRLTEKLNPGPEKKVRQISVDPIYNAVRLKINYQPGDISLDRMPLVLEVSTMAKEIVFESVGGTVSAN